MQFVISKTANDQWNIKPLAGKFEGQLIATVDGINMKAVKFFGRTMIGNIQAMWGAVILLEDIYADPETLRSMHLGGVFDTRIEERLVLDFDGFVDAANKACRGASKILAIGSNIYSKGAC